MVSFHVYDCRIYWFGFFFKCLNNNMVNLEAYFFPTLVGWLVGRLFSPGFQPRLLPGSNESHPVFPRVPWTAGGAVSHDLPRYSAHPEFVSESQLSSTFRCVISCGPHYPALLVGRQTFVSEVRGEETPPHAYLLQPRVGLPCLHLSHP